MEGLETEMKVPIIFVCLVALGVIVSLSNCYKAEKPPASARSVEDRWDKVGVVTQMPVQISNCQVPAIIVAHAQDPVVWSFVDETYSITLHPRTDPTGPKTITPANFYASQSGKMFFWDPSGTPYDCKDSVTSGITTIAAGCSIKYDVTGGGSCKLDPIVQIIPDGGLMITATPK